MENSNGKCRFGFEGWVMFFILFYFIEYHLLSILSFTEVHRTFAFRQMLGKKLNKVQIKKKKSKLRVFSLNLRICLFTSESIYQRHPAVFILIFQLY